MDTPKVSAAKNSGLQDDHDPNDLGQKLANKSEAEKSQMEGPAAYAPHGASDKEQQPGQDQPADRAEAPQTSSRRQDGGEPPPLQNTQPDTEAAKKKSGEV